MSTGNITFLSGPSFGIPASRVVQVASGAAGSIKFGEPVKINGAARRYAIPLADAEPVIGTTAAVLGIANSTSTDTVAAAGTVEVWMPTPGVVYLCNAKTAANIATQALYDALVGTRVLFDLTSGVYTVDEATADNAANGLQIVDLDIKKYPGKVAFIIKDAATYLV